MQKSKCNFKFLFKFRCQSILMIREVLSWHDQTKRCLCISILHKTIELAYLHAQIQWYTQTHEIQLNRKKNHSYTRAHTHTHHTHTHTY